MAYFDLYTAWRIWFFISAILVIITYVCIAYDSLKTRPLLLCGLFIALISVPVSQNFFIGQTSCIEAAVIALSLRFLIDKKYFWAGLIAAISLLKLQQMLIILIPGFCVGKKDFLRGFLLLIAIETLVSLIVVGYYNVPNFIRTNYMAEVLHSFSDGNDNWYYTTFRGMLNCLPWFIGSADKIAEAVYTVLLLALSVLWLKIFPVLQKVSSQAIQLTASITTIVLVLFSLHGYWYDYALYIIPCLWLYIWSTSDDESYAMPQSVIRLFISVIIFYTPFFYWDSLTIMVTADSTITWYQARNFCCGMTLLCCAIIALILESHKCQNRTVSRVS